MKELMLMYVFVIISAVVFTWGYNKGYEVAKTTFDQSISCPSGQVKMVCEELHLER